MTAAELTTVQAALLKLRGELVAAGAVEVRAELDSPVASARDQDEGPLVEMGQTIASVRNRERAERLAQIDECLRMLLESPSEYGLCEGCGEPIPVRRLALLPFASHCVPCQSKSEVDPHGPGRRKITDYR